MSGFCVVSLIQDDADFVLSLLQKAGLNRSVPAERDESLTISRWHEQVLALPIEFYVESVAQAGSGPVEVRQEIGRLWEQLASDIFIANMNSGAWGWADARSADLLPFWAGFDPQLKFVLVTCSPERYVANFIEASDKPFEPQVLLARWQAYQQALLHFNRLNPKRSVLTSFEDVLMSPQGLVDTCNDTFFTQLGRIGLSALRGFPMSQMAALVATKFATPNKEQAALDRELRASLTPLKVTMHAPRLANEADTAKEGKAKGKRDSAKQVAEGDATNRATTDSSIDADVLGSDDDLPQSNDPAEIIAHYRRIMAEVQRDQPGSLRSKASDDVMDVQYRDESASAGISGDVSVGRQSSADEMSELQRRLDESQAKLKDVEEENDLLLAQLHQVQEELEVYFLKHQEVSAEHTALQARFQKLLARVPGYMEVDGVEIVAFDKTKSLSTQWRVKGLESAGQILPEFEFRTFVENGVACIEFKREPDGKTVLNRWPARGDEYEAVVAAVGDEVTGPHRARVLQGISTSDWLLVRTINTLLTKELDKPEILALPSGFNAKGVSKAVSELQLHLATLPPVLHFDEIRLRDYREDSEHEYLAFSFSNLLFGEQHWPSFEFRFASVNVPAGNFGSNPRLEFHEMGAKGVLEGWFKESEDDDGAKLELRFAQSGVMDMDVWARIKPRDKKLIGALIAQLPMFIDQVEEGKVRLGRSWNDWSSLAETVHRYFLACSGGLIEGLEIDSDDGQAEVEVAEKPRLTRGRKRTLATQPPQADGEVAFEANRKRLTRRGGSPSSQAVGAAKPRLRRNR